MSVPLVSLFVISRSSLPITSRDNLGRDIVIFVLDDGAREPALRSVVQESSSVMTDMLNSRTYPCEFRLSGVPSGPFSALLRLLHGHHEMVPRENIPDLLKLAFYFNIREIVGQCLHVLQSHFINLSEDLLVVLYVQDLYEQELARLLTGRLFTATWKHFTRFARPAIFNDQAIMSQMTMRQLQLLQGVADDEAETATREGSLRGARGDAAAPDGGDSNNQRRVGGEAMQSRWWWRPLLGIAVIAGAGLLLKYHYNGSSSSRVSSWITKLALRSDSKPTMMSTGATPGQWFDTSPRPQDGFCLTLLPSFRAE